MPMRLRQEIQEMLRAQLIATAAFTGGLPYNLTRAMNIVGIKQFLTAIRA